MLNNDKIVKTFNLKNIIKEYPKSGQKKVFLVEHNEYGKVMLKLVEDDNNNRIKREIQILNENHFDNVPKVIKMDNFSTTDQNGLYILEEYIDGNTLRDILNTYEKLSLDETLKLAKDLLKIIVQMEDNKIVHRDIKPENIIKNTNGDWYLIDFGIARALDLNSLTLTEVAVGPHTPGYGAPELFQYSKTNIDSRADIFSLGVILFESATGNHPFLRGDELDLNEIWYQTATVTPNSIQIDGDIDMEFMDLIQTFMQKLITRRPSTAKKALEWFNVVNTHINS